MNLVELSKKDFDAKRWKLLYVNLHSIYECGTVNGIGSMLDV